MYTMQCYRQWTTQIELKCSSVSELAADGQLGGDTYIEVEASDTYMSKTRWSGVRP